MYYIQHAVCHTSVLSAAVASPSPAAVLPLTLTLKPPLTMLSTSCWYMIPEMKIKNTKCNECQRESSGDDVYIGRF